MRHPAKITREKAPGGFRKSFGEGVGPIRPPRGSSAGEGRHKPTAGARRMHGKPR